MLVRTDQARTERLEQVLALVREKVTAESRSAVETFATLRKSKRAQRRSRPDCARPEILRLMRFSNVRH